MHGTLPILSLPFLRLRQSHDPAFKPLDIYIVNLRKRLFTTVLSVSPINTSSKFVGIQNNSNRILKL